MFPVPTSIAPARGPLLCIVLTFALLRLGLIDAVLFDFVLQSVECGLLFAQLGLAVLHSLSVAYQGLAVSEFDDTSVPLVHGVGGVVANWWLGSWFWMVVPSVWSSPSWG